MKEFAEKLLEFWNKGSPIKSWSGIQSKIADKPLIYDWNKDGCGDGEHPDKQEEEVLNEQDNFPLDIQASMEEDVCVVDIEPAWANKGDEEVDKE